MRSRYAWEDLEALYQAFAARPEEVYATAEHAARDRLFIAGRFGEGRRLAAFLADRFQFSHTLRVLDVGTGNAGVAIALANMIDSSVVALDHSVNQMVRPLIGASRLPLRYLAASGAALPFGDCSFDVVLCLETIEHVQEPKSLGAEIMRVLKPGGLCVITTPPRLRFLLRRDPHFGIPGLLLLPDWAQRIVATKIARVTPAEEYDVAHIYWYAGSVARLFPNRDLFQAVGAPPTNRLARRMWSFLQRFIWERCIVTKAVNAKSVH